MVVFGEPGTGSVLVLLLVQVRSWFKLRTIEQQVCFATGMRNTVDSYHTVTVYVLGPVLLRFVVH